MLPLNKLAQHWSISKEALRRHWEREGFPRLVKAWNGLYLVSVDEVKQWLAERRVPTEAETARRRSIVRRAAGSAGVRRLP